MGGLGLRLGKLLKEGAVLDLCKLEADADTLGDMNDMTDLNPSPQPQVIPIIQLNIRHCSLPLSITLCQHAHRDEERVINGEVRPLELAITRLEGSVCGVGTFLLPGTDGDSLLGAG
jgi:hypothetical protein